jgi:signal transduction histidine kinase
MSRGSIRFRLLAAAAFAVALALMLAEIGLTHIFERHVERRLDAELSVDLKALIAGLAFVEGKAVVTKPPTDPRFSNPLSGLYWQVEALGGGPPLRSRSLWDFTMSVPATAGGGRAILEIAGPAGALLRVLAQDVRIASSQGDRSLRVIVGVDHAEVTRATRDFAIDVIVSLTILGILLLAALWFQVKVGLAPLDRLRTSVSHIVSGRASRLPVDVPSEVRPLAQEINALLAAQDETLGKARARAGDLAHGLKTPLQALAAHVRSLHDKGEHTLADEIDQVATTLRRHVERELARARLNGASPPSLARTANVRTVAAGIAAVLERTPRGSALDLAVDAPLDLSVPIDEADLAEILGNLGENACRFARARVRIFGHAVPDGIETGVLDDGPGIPQSQQRTALSRGGRLDSRPGGEGLGLSIVAEMVDAYGGSFRLEDAHPGLRATVTIPTARNVS